MTNYNRYKALKTVIQSLETIMTQADHNPQGHSEILTPELWREAQRVVAYIADNQPNL